MATVRHRPFGLRLRPSRSAKVSALAAVAPLASPQWALQVLLGLDQVAEGLLLVLLNLLDFLRVNHRLVGRKAAQRHACLLGVTLQTILLGARPLEQSLLRDGEAQVVGGPG